MESYEIDNTAMSLHIVPDEEKKIEHGEEETDDEKMRRRGLPPHDIMELLKECDYKSSIDKLDEHGALRPPVFWNLEEGDFTDMAGMEVKGKRKFFMYKFDKIKKDHEKKMDDLYAK